MCWCWRTVRSSASLWKSCRVDSLASFRVCGHKDAQHVHKHVGLSHCLELSVRLSLLIMASALSVLSCPSLSQPSSPSCVAPLLEYWNPPFLTYHSCLDHPVGQFGGDTWTRDPSEAPMSSLIRYEATSFADLDLGIFFCFSLLNLIDWVTQALPEPLL